MRRARNVSLGLLSLSAIAAALLAAASGGRAEDKDGKTFRFTKERTDGEIGLAGEDANLREVLDEIGRRVGKTLLLEAGVDTRVTIPDLYHFKKAEWEQPVFLLAKLCNLEVESSAEKVVLKRPAPAAPKAPFREFPIGDEVEREAEHMKVAAVWLPPVTMDHECGCAAGPDVVHLECDVHATRGNTHGFAAGDWIPYMTVSYTIEPEKAGNVKNLSGKLMPMVAKDGPHYGATIAMPARGRFKLTFRLEPPSVNGLGRHTDPVTGVSEWWQAFEATYAWDYRGVPVETKTPETPPR
ncbi:iron transporter [bacterium]|nr:iron transporter [bacterium]